MHRVFVGDLVDTLAPGDTVELPGDEAAHVLRVKRLGPGDTLTLLDGRGGIGVGTLLEPESRWAATGGRDKGHSGKRERTVGVRVDSVQRVPEPSPRLEVWSAVPKGGSGGRVDEMIDQLSQVGADVLVPMRCARSVVEPREHKLERLRRIAVESAKQCGRAWLLDIEALRDMEDAWRSESHDHGSDACAIVIADASGQPPTPATMTRLREHAHAAGRVRVLIGPEGGFESAELQRAREILGERLSVLRFGPHIMRIETAAVVACARVLEAVRQHASS